MRYDVKWNVALPPDTDTFQTTIPDEAVEDFERLVSQVCASCGDQKSAYETVKHAFRSNAGKGPDSSSDEAWAKSDMEREMKHLRTHPPAFIKSFCEAMEGLQSEGLDADQTLGPDEINVVLERYKVGYRIVKDRIVLAAGVAPIAVPHMDALGEARADLDRALSKAKQALERGEGRQAVQEVFWVAESIFTVFDGKTVDGTVVGGGYFTTILKSLKKASRDTFREFILRQLEAVHGFLSDPAGGGVRHGKVLAVPSIETHEAEWVCRVVGAAANYVLAEYKRLTQASSKE